MSKHLSKECFYKLPSGAEVHPCSLIIRDGIVMWKHALAVDNQFTAVPETQAQEQHIIKTAQRLEELNTWVSQDLEPWQSIRPYAWFDPTNPLLATGISVYFTHDFYSNHKLYDILIRHIHPHEALELHTNAYSCTTLPFFRRC